MVNKTRLLLSLTEFSRSPHRSRLSYVSDTWFQKDNLDTGRRGGPPNSHADTKHEKYAKVLQLVNSGTPTSDATKASSLPKSTFYKWKAVAEMNIVDGDQVGLISRL